MEFCEMSTKHGNDREGQRQRIENKIIRRIDENPGDQDHYREHGPLRVSILELICFRAAVSGLPAIRRV